MHIASELNERYNSLMIGVSQFDWQVMWALFFLYTPEIVEVILDGRQGRR